MVSELQNQLNAIAKAKTVKVKTDLIRVLPHPLRIAGYLQARSALAFIGAKLRLTHSHDNDWGEAERAEWNVAHEAYSLWWDALNEDEQQMLSSVSLDTVIDRVTRGETVMPTEFTRYRLTLMRPGIKYDYQYSDNLGHMRRLAAKQLQGDGSDYPRARKAIIEVCHDRPRMGRPASWYDLEEIKRSD